MTPGGLARLAHDLGVHDMGSVAYSQAVQLSHCQVMPSVFDSLVTDNFLRLLPVELIEGDCASYPLIAEANKPTTIEYVSSGGAISTSPVGYGAGADYALKRIVTRAVVDGDIASNLSMINDVAEDQALALAQLVVQEVGSQLWAESPGANSPAGMPSFALENPEGVAQPVKGSGAGPKVPDDLMCLLRRQSPWSPDSQRYFAMNSSMYYSLIEQAWASGTSMVEFRPDVHTGQTMAHFADVPIAVTDHISLTEGQETGTTSIYLVRVGQSEADPKKISGVHLLTSEAWPSVEVGSERPNDGSADEYFMEVSWNVAFANFSRSSVVRAKGFAL